MLHGMMPPADHLNAFPSHRSKTSSL
jgi:hypothetical protein